MLSTTTRLGKPEAVGVGVRACDCVRDGVDESVDVKDAVAELVPENEGEAEDVTLEVRV